MAELVTEKEQTFNARKNLRLKHLSHVRFSTELDGDLYTGLTQNFSADGLQILTSQTLLKGQELSLYVSIAPYGIVPITASVQWVSISEENPDSPYWIKSGLKINYENQKTRKTVLSYLKERFQKHHFKLKNITTA